MRGRYENRMQCPVCGSGRLDIRLKGGFYCRSCKIKRNGSPLHADRKPAKAGSGQVAGPITIPSYRWGSSRLG
jgi:ribosomal protein L37AE/L43A